MKEDPCFSCRLPDCDETSPRCALRQLANSYNRKRQRGLLHLVDERERFATAELHKIWTCERFAEAADGGRPFRRGTRLVDRRSAAS